MNSISSRALIALIATTVTASAQFSRIPVLTPVLTPLNPVKVATGVATASPIRSTPTAKPPVITTEPVAAENGAGGALILRGKFPKGTTAQLEYSKTLAVGDWTPLGTPEVLADGHAEVTAPKIGGQCYYRLKGKSADIKISEILKKGTFAKTTKEFQWEKVSDIAKKIALPTPELFAMGNNELVTTMTRKGVESWTLPMVWSVGNTHAKSATWVIQTVPFENGPAYNPASLALSGGVAMPDFGGGPEMVQLALDFSEASVLGLDYGGTAYARLWEKRADGTRGPGSNVFTFQVAEAPSTVKSGNREDWTIPEGTLKLTHPYLGCIETTDGYGSDQTLAAAYVLKFGEDGVTVDKLLTGAEEFDPGDSVYSAPSYGTDIFGDRTILSFTGPEFPDNRNTWVVYLLDELDEDEWHQFWAFGLARGNYFSDEILTTNEVEHKATQYWNLIKDAETLDFGFGSIDLPDTPGEKQSLVCAVVREHIKDVVADRTVSEVFASTHFRIGDSHIEKALSTGRYKRSINLQGDGAEYFAEFQLDWQPK